MNETVISKIVALFHGGASVRRIARSLRVSRRTVAKVLAQGDVNLAGPVRVLSEG